MPQSIKTYLRTQEIGPVIGNMICNPLLAWLGNRDMEGVALFGDHGLIIDTAITSIVASLLVTLFAVSGVRRDLKAGRIAVPEEMARPKSLLVRLPQNAWAFGLAIGVGIALVLGSLTLAVFHLFTVSEVPFKAFLVIKVAYTGLLGLGVARWAILRQLAGPGLPRKPRGPARSRPSAEP